MKRVIIESPYASNAKYSVEQHVAFARACMKDCLRRGEAPFAAHLLYTQPGILDDTIAEERKFGIAAGLAWAEVADTQVFYPELGWSLGMMAAREWARLNNKTIIERALA